MTRSFTLLNRLLLPTTTIFLGDLFDGGREWAPPTRNGAARKQHLKDPRAESDWGAYGTSYWESEFVRFNKIFPALPGRRSIRSLPGNHDLGIGNGIEEGVLERYRAFFGDTSAVHVFGNHTFVMIDSVSLENTLNPAVYEPPREFLEDFTNQIPAATRGLLLDHTVHSSDEKDQKVPVPPLRQIDLPRILLTHVPLYRLPDTDCGPLRESTNHAISVRGGFQYQNVLTADLTSDILRKVQPVLVASGDDHDYCEVLHAGATGMVKEITVKSISLAMGVRRPGFLLVSLWNPAGSKGGTDPPTTANTVQTKLCLLPDQLGIFAMYGVAFMLTKLALTLNVIRLWLRSKRNPSSLLPTTTDHRRREKAQSTDDYAISASSWSSTAPNGISTRNSSSGSSSSNSAPRPSYGYGIPSASPSTDDDDDKYAKRPTGASVSGMPNIERNINTHLTHLGTAAREVGSRVADKFVERVPALAPVVEGGKEMVRREIENSGGMGGWCAKMWHTAKELAICVLVVGGWYLWLLFTDV